VTSLAALILPILLSAVAIFLVSSVIHMMIPWHKSDYAKLPNEDRVLEALRPFSIPAGDYMGPKPDSMADFKSPAFLEKRSKGPNVIVTVLPNGPITMGPQLIGWFIYLVVLATFAACVAATALTPGAPGKYVFHYVALVSFGAFSFGLWPMSIWFKRALSTTIKSTIDGLIYACIMGGIFSWLWPK
jgi:hypothetical protein